MQVCLPQLFYVTAKLLSLSGNIISKSCASLTPHIIDKCVCFNSQMCEACHWCATLARGLDIPHIRTVVNYDVARDIDTHTHRIGRTGRAGEKGTAFTLVTNKDKDFAGHLVRNLEGANQYVPPDLMDIAMQVCLRNIPHFSVAKRRLIQGSFLSFGFVVLYF